MDAEIKDTFGIIKNIENVIVFGCGGHARSVINVLRKINNEIEIVLVDKNAGEDEVILGCKTKRQYTIRETDGYIIAIGDNRRRRQIYEQVKKNRKGYCISLISQYADIGMDSWIGEGSFIASRVHIGPQAVVRENTIINTGSIIEHEVKVGSNVHIAPHTTVCGRTEIGNNVFCGAGSVVLDNINICDDAVIGAGAVVKEDIIERGTYVGVPARKVNQEADEGICWQ